jgi:hypothetical protein
MKLPKKKGYFLSLTGTHVHYYIKEEEKKSGRTCLTLMEKKTTIL